MPPLSMFGRHWRISSDDFVCPAATELLVRISWIFILVFVLVFHIQEIENLECLGEHQEYQLTTIYLCVSIGFLALTLILNLLITCHSARGKIVEHVSDNTRHPRAWVPYLLYLNVAFTVIEFIWTGIGAYFTIVDFMNCIDQEHERTVIIAVLIIICLFYLLLLVKIFLVLCSFRPYAKIRSGEQSRLLGSEERRKREENLNYLGLRCIAPCTNDADTLSAFKDIAGTLSMIFGDKDLVPSDIVAGLIILSHVQSIERAAPTVADSLNSRKTVFDSMGVSLVRVETENDINVCFEMIGSNDRMSLDWTNVKHYYKFAAASYGYMWWMMQAPVTHCCKLGYYLQCCNCCRNSESLFIEGDGVFKPNYSAIKAMLNIDDNDVIVFDNRNMIEEVPFLLLADKETKSLVISIRGTLSLHDMLTDLRSESSVFLENHPDWTGHQGMVNAANYVLKRLHGQETGREQRISSGRGGSNRNSRTGQRPKDILNCSLTDPEYEGYDIVVTGHSLGAGTATILAFLLRDKYPETKVTCYAYSPPGGLLSLAASKESEKFAVSVVVGDDVIPRLSLPNIGALSKDIKQAITMCQLPKYQIFGYGCMACCFNRREIKPLYEELERLQLSLTSNNTESGLDAVLNNSHEELLSSPPLSASSTEHPPSVINLLSKPPMYLPGRVLHITEAPGSSYSVSEQDKFQYNKILVSPTMLTDHFPNSLNEVLQSCPDSMNVLPILV